MYLLQEFFGAIESIGSYARFVWDVIVAAIMKPPKWALIREQLFEVGLQSLPVVAMTGFSTGLVLAAQAFFQLSDMGLVGTTGIMVGEAMITELGPVLTAFMITGRVGASMCAELGTMYVTEQIDALQSMAVSPNRYLVAPRFIAATFMTPLLTIFSICMGIFGGYLITVYFFHMSPTTYFDPMPTHIHLFDLFMGFTKSVIFGIQIVTISCFRGMTTRGGAAGVGRATTNSVVICYTAILFSNFFITLGLNLVRSEISRWLT
ncbi:MAG: ABC transporter permease [Chlamydiales bacterium]|nr:ABC transporter permease [Chlamydiales bacterium]